ncbi:hypothetical protein DVH24_021326 [Malus domestica]|uniref:Uncharacterized protein n=1 Tax=Malus domestica TaxID=3750 RepID=A0A498KV50_MALDO|nr:hypothetical protein DVH24_021326 [Malus domestica]
MFPKVHAGMEMDMVKDCGKNGGNALKRLQIFAERMETISGFGLEHVWTVARDDPRRPLFVGIGQNAIWAVMTVVVVLEFTAEYIATESGRTFRAVFIGAAVFLIGEELHNSTVFKLEGLARAIEACVNEYFREETELNQDKSTEDPIYEGYKAVLDSKSLDETMRYVKLGNVLRHFGYTIVALHGCLGTEIQTPRSVRLLFKDPCIRLAGEQPGYQHACPSSCTRHTTKARSLVIKRENRQFSAARVENKEANEQAKEPERKFLRPQLSKIAITSLEFSGSASVCRFCISAGGDGGKVGSCDRGS